MVVVVCGGCEIWKISLLSNTGLLGKKMIYVGCVQKSTGTQNRLLKVFIPEKKIVEFERVAILILLALLSLREQQGNIGYGKSPMNIFV